MELNWWCCSSARKWTETWLGKALLWTWVTPTLVHSPRRQSLFLLSLFRIFDFNTVVLHFIFAVCVMKCKHFSRVSWDHFPYSKTISTLFLKYQRTKATCFCTPDPSVLQSIPFYFLPDNARKYLPVFFQSCMWVKYMPIHYCIHQQK